MVVKLGTLRYIYVRTLDTLPAGQEDSIKQTVLGGDKYSYAIDGMLINVQTITNPHKLLIDFSIFKPEGETKILQSFPYSVRGTRYNQNYIPLKKDTDYEILPVRQQIYVKLLNNDTVNDLAGIAYAVLGYPVKEEQP